MNDRIKTIRSALKLTQAEFGKRLGLSQNYIWMIERGDRTPSDRTLMDLCREFSVNEVWLREGVGPMFVERSRRDDLFDYARRILGGDLSDTEAAVLAVMAETTPEEWELFAAKVRAIVDGLDAKKEQTLDGLPALL